MIDKPLLSFLLCVLFSVCYGQEKIKGDRNVTISESNINSFNRLVVGDEFKIDLIEGANATVFVEADDNLHEVIQYEVADSTLYFSLKKKVTTFKKMAIKVTYTKTLKQIETKDNAQVSSLTSLSLDGLVLQNSGTSKAFLNVRSNTFKLINNERAKVKLNVEAAHATLELNENSKTEALISSENLDVDLYQRANAKIEGDATVLDIMADNSSDFTGKNLTVKTATVNSDFSSKVSVQVLESLVVNARGNSEIFIYENPKITIETFAGSAKLHKKEMK